MDTSQVPVPEKVGTAHSETVSSLHTGDRAGAGKLFGQHVRRASCSRWHGASKNLYRTRVLWS